MLLFNLLWFANKYDKVTTACSKWLKIEKEKEKKKTKLSHYVANFNWIWYRHCHT